MSASVKCKICDKMLLPSCWNQHISGKKHVNLTPKKILVKAPFAREKIDELNKHFEQFGAVISQQILSGLEDDKIVVEYGFDAAATTSIVHREHTVLGKKLDISWIKSLTSPMKVQNQQQTLPSTPKEQNQIIPTIPSPQQKHVPVARETKLQTKSLQKFADKSEQSMKNLINSLRQKTTFVEQVNFLYAALKSNHEELENSRKTIKNDLHVALTPMFPSVTINMFGSSITGLDIQGSDLDVYIANVRHQSKPELATLRLIRTFLFKCKKFCDVLLISGAKIPVIKCIHTKTQLCCDLNIRNKLAVENSELIKCYLSFDEKLPKLFVMIKFWAEQKGLKKVSFFSSYALYMMTIFYLQQEPYNLPSVMELQRNVSPDIVDGWNCAFSREQRTSPALQDASMIQIALGFFKFYGEFDYITYVICPYIGKALRKTCFLKPQQVPDCYQMYLNQAQLLPVNEGFSIQDPFEHARNVTTYVPLSCTSRFVVLCQQVATLLTRVENELLFRLVVANTNLKEYCFKIEQQDNSPPEQWKDRLQNAAVKMLNEVFSYEVTTTNLVGSGNIMYACLGTRNVWDNRVSVTKKVLPKLPPNASDLEREIAVTASTNNYFAQNMGNKLNIKLSFTKQPLAANFQILLQVKWKIFHHVAFFFHTLLQKTMRQEAVRAVLSPPPSIEQLRETNEKSKTVEIVKLEDPIEDGEIVEISSEEPTVVNDNMSVGDTFSEETNEISSNQSDGMSEIVDSCVKQETIQEEQENDRTKKTDEEELEAEKEQEIRAEQVPLKQEPTEEEEDVPPDFFDDFSNQDFMDGLDIVDAWDDGAKMLDVKTATSIKRQSPSPIVFDTKPKDKPMEKRTRNDKSRSRSPVSRRKNVFASGSRKRSRSKSQEKSRNELRRDPEKTKRDIHRDKLKCARDKEQKLVKDRLKIVETGLVPPGTELEVDVSTIIPEKHGSSTTEHRSSSILEKHSPVRYEKYAPLRYEKRSPVRREQNSSSIHERHSPIRREKYSGTRNVEKRSAEKRRSERRYQRSSSRERRRLRSRSPDAYRHRQRVREGEHRRRSVSQESRELRRRSRKRSRSRSRDSSHRQKRKYEEMKKKSFLEEIRDKLNEVRQPVMVSTPPIYPNIYNSTPIPVVPTPVPVPAPTTTPFYPPMPQQYDQTFFIGEGYQNVMNPTHSLGFNAVEGAGNVAIVPQTPIVASSNPETSQKRTNMETTDNIDKLFADKKISLSDFLAITAKCEVNSASPEHLQKKIKVISRCQEAIKAMSDGRKFSGPLSVKPSPENKPKTEVKYQSPLRRIPVIRFQFTSPAKTSEEETDGFALALEKILHKIGIKGLLNLNELSDAPKNGVDEDATPASLRALTSKLSAGAVSCEECKKRTSKTFANVGIQCTPSNEKVNIGVQVAGEDSTPPKIVSRNESIAYLTPAQLLGKEKNKLKETEGDVIIVSDSPQKNNLSENSMGKTNSPIRGRINVRKNFGRSLNYDNEAVFDRTRASASGFGYSYGGPNRQGHMQQFPENEDMMSDFPQAYRGRKPKKFGPRF